jgi:hypothetical protein
MTIDTLHTLALVCLVSSIASLANAAYLWWKLSRAYQKINQLEQRHAPLRAASMKYLGQEKDCGYGQDDQSI